MSKNPCGRISLDINVRKLVGELRTLTWPLSYKTVEIHHHDAGPVWGKTCDLIILMSYNEGIFKVLTKQGLFFLTEEEVIEDTQGFT